MNNLFVIYGLIPEKTAKLAKLIADRNDLYFLSVNDLIEYEFSKVVFDYENCHNDYFMAGEIKHRKARRLFLQGQGRKGRVGTSILGVSLRAVVCKASWQSE